MSPNDTLHLPVTVTRLLLPVLAPNLPLDAVDGLLLGVELRESTGRSYSPWHSSPLVTGISRVLTKEGRRYSMEEFLVH